MSPRVLLAATALALGCGGDPTGPNGLAPSTGFQYTFSDPVGDTVPPPTNVFSRALDVRSLRVGLTSESYVSLRDDGAGHMLRRVGETEEWREVRVEFSERSFTVRLARADVGETDGAFRVSAMIGGTGRTITDVAPNAGHYRVP